MNCASSLRARGDERKGEKSNRTRRSDAEPIVVVQHRLHFVVGEVMLYCVGAARRPVTEG